MLKLLNHNIILPKYLEIVKKKGSSLTFSAQGGWGKEKKEKSAKKIAVGSEGAAEGGCGGNSAAPEPKRSPAAMLVQSRVPQKSFLFLLEEKEIARQIKKCEENFFAEQRAKRAAAGRFIRDFAQNESELFGIMTTKQKFRFNNRNFCLVVFV